MSPGTSYWRRQSSLGAVVSIPMALLIAAYLGHVLSLNESGWRVFVGSVAVLVLPLFAIGIHVMKRNAIPLLALIDEGATGDAEIDRERFAALLRVPQDGVLITVATWLIGGSIVVAISWAATPDFGVFEAAATLAACLGASVACGTFIYGVSQRMLIDTRRAAARELPVELREAATRRVRIRTKLQVCFLTTSVLPLLLTVFLVDAQGGGQSNLSALVFLVAGLSGAFAMTLAWLLARDMADTTNSLLDGLARLASRDLRPLDLLEADDEFGELARACGRLSQGVGEVVQRMAESAARIGGAATTLGVTSARVQQASTRQTEGAELASQRLQAIATDAGQMTERSQRLQASVEESSSTIVEFSASSSELRTVANQLVELIDHAVSALAQIAEGTEHITARVEALTQLTDAANSAAEELGVSAEEIDREATETGRLAASVIEASQRGRDHVRRSDDGMRSIQDAVGASAAALEELHTQVRKISAVVEMIEEVAAETHLLSLNAAIIAAQAGEDGRGFAVVAGEVKGLATRVTRRTREISQIIESVETSAECSGAAMEESRLAVAEGLELWKGAGAALEEIAGAAGESGDRVNEILREIRSQGIATQQIRTLMSNVADDVGAIAEAVTSQSEGQRSMVSTANLIREVASIVHRSVEEQARGTATLQSGVAVVEEATRHIDDGLESQSEACRSASELIDDVHTRAAEQRVAAERVEVDAQRLAAEASALSSEAARFKLPDAFDPAD